MAAIHPGNAPPAGPLLHDGAHPPGHRCLQDLRAGAGPGRRGRAGARNLHSGQVSAAHERSVHIVRRIDRPVRLHHGVHHPVPEVRRSVPGAAMTTTAPPRAPMATMPRPRTRRDPLEVPLKVTFPFWVIGSALLVLFPIYLIFMVSFAPGSAVFVERPQPVVTVFTL